MIVDWHDFPAMAYQLKYLNFPTDMKNISPDHGLLVRWLGGKLGSIQIARYKKSSTWLFGASIQPSIPSKSGSSPYDHQLLTCMFLKTSSYELLTIGRVTTCMPLSKCYIKFFNKHVVWWQKVYQINIEKYDPHIRFYINLSFIQMVFWIYIQQLADHDPLIITSIGPQ